MKSVCKHLKIHIRLQTFEMLPVSRNVDVIKPLQTFQCSSVWIQVLVYEILFSFELFQPR